MGSLPADIPANPNQTYKDKGWKGMGDWLGTGRIANQNRRYRPFDEARAFTRSLNLKDVNEWRMFCKGSLSGKGRLPQDIPTAPDSIYADQGWVGFGDWLGTGTVATFRRQYRSFSQARNFVRSLGLRGEAQWREYCRRELPEKGFLPHDIPANPTSVFAKSGWISWPDWLGTGGTRVSRSKMQT